MLAQTDLYVINVLSSSLMYIEGGLSRECREHRVTLLSASVPATFRRRWFLSPFDIIIVKLIVYPAPPFDQRFFSCLGIEL